MDIKFWEAQRDLVTDKSQLFGDADVIGANTQSQNQYFPNSITINNTSITAKMILDRQSAIRQSIPPDEYKNLTTNERLIIDLPIILVKLGWLYSAYFQIHWLENTGNNVEIPTSFVLQYERSKDAYKDMLNHFTQMRYASTLEYNHLAGFSLRGSSNDVMYDFNLESTQNAYYKAVNFLKVISDYREHTFGNFNFNETPPKMNFFRSHVIGSARGHLDDLGASLGRLSLRVYAKGKVQNQDLNDPVLRQYSLKINDIAYRFIDEFSFNSEQYLGDWKYDLQNPLPPSKWYKTGWITLNNDYYRKLRARGLGLGKDYLIQTNTEYISQNDIKKIKPIIFLI